MGAAVAKKPRAQRREMQRAGDALRRHHAVERTTETYWPDGTQEVARAERVTHDRVVDQDTLDWLRSRGHLKLDLWRAGDLLRTDWQTAGYEALRAADLAKPGGIGGGGSPVEGDRRLDAQQRVMDATRAIGKARSWMTITVVCAGARLRHVEREMTMREGSALEVLRGALSDLADHYAAKRRM